MVPIIARWEPPGASLLAGILILAIMILPTIALTCEAALYSVPNAYLRGAAALGLGKKAIVLNVAIPAGKIGLDCGESCFRRHEHWGKRWL